MASGMNSLARQRTRDWRMIAWGVAALVLLLPFVAYAALPLSSDRPGGKSFALILLAVAALATATGATLQLRDERRRHCATEQSGAA